MAPGYRRSRRKRQRDEDEDESEQEPEREVPRRKKAGWLPSLGSFIGIPANPETFDDDISRSASPVIPEPAPIKMTDQERSAFIANKIDEHHFAQQAIEADAILRDPKRKLVWRPDITADDDEWMKFFEMINGELGKHSVLTILDKYFEEGQKFMILPPGPDGAIGEIQEEHTKQYKKSLAVGGEFYGKAQDNMTTKLTMLHFGLPVEHMSRNNIFRAGRFPNEDDPPDEDIGPDRYERIYYATKPLEFLDNYWQRGFGHPILRRPRPTDISPPKNPPPLPPAGVRNQAVGQRGGAGSPEEISHPPPIYPQTHGTVGQRGGAGSQRATSRSPKKKSKDPAGNDEVVMDLAPPIGPRDNFNRERILKARAAEIKIQKYDPWLAEQRRQDRLQRESYYTDHRAIVPGKKPEPPLFGMTRELMLSVSDALPTLYGHRLTPTDINAILDENQNARNKILERMDVCPLCPDTFQKYKAHEWQAHLKKHAEQIASAGKCPVCETEQWAMMDMQQKKRHVAFHQNQQSPWKEELEPPRKFYWDIVHCPICGVKFSSLGQAEDVVYHLAEHQPGMLRFCDRCGLEKAACDDNELTQHKTMCIDGPERLEDDPELFFCEACGTNRTNETEEGRINHRTICNTKNGLRFCRKCGIQMNHLSAMDRSAHLSRCRPVRGWKGKHCQRCGEDLSIHNGEQRKEHLMQSCSFNNKYKPSQQETFGEMKKMVERQEDLLARMQVEASEARTNQLKIAFQQDGLSGKCPEPGCSTLLKSVPQIATHMELHLKKESPEATTKTAIKAAILKPQPAQQEDTTSEFSEEQPVGSDSFQPLDDSDSGETSSRGKNHEKKYKKYKNEDGDWVYYTDSDDDEPSGERGKKPKKPTAIRRDPGLTRVGNKTYTKTLDKDGNWIYVTDVEDETIPSDEIASDFTPGGTRIPKGTKGERAKAERTAQRKATKAAATPKGGKVTKATKTPAPNREGSGNKRYLEVISEDEKPRKKIVSKTPKSIRQTQLITSDSDIQVQQQDTDDDDDDDDNNEQITRTQRPPKRTAAKVAKKSNKAAVEDEDSSEKPFNAGQYELNPDSESDPDKTNRPRFVSKSTRIRKKSEDEPYIYRKLSDIPMDMRDHLDEDDVELIKERLKKGPLSPRWIKNGKIMPHYSATRHSPTLHPKPTSSSKSPKKPLAGSGAIRGTRAASKLPTTATSTRSTRITKTPAAQASATKAQSAPKSTPKTTGGRRTGRSGDKRDSLSMVALV